MITLNTHRHEYCVPSSPVKANVIESLMETYLDGFTPVVRILGALGSETGNKENSTCGPQCITRRSSFSNLKLKPAFPSQFVFVYVFMDSPQALA